MNNSKQRNLLIIADRFWPSIGGIENAIRNLITHLPDAIQSSVLTHSSRADSSTLYGHYNSSTPKPQKDSAGHAIFYLKPSFMKRIYLLPLLLWNFPGIKQIIPTPLLFDILYIFYKWAFYADVKRSMTATDLVHSFSTGYLARLAGEICRKVSIPIVHSPAVHFNKWGDSPRQLRSYVNGNALIFFSAMMKQEMASRTGGNQKNWYVIPPVTNANSVISDRRNIAHHPVIDDPYILFLGRREKHKGLHLLIDAFKKISTPAKLVIAGPGEKCSEKDSSIVDLGAVSDVMKAYLLSHCELFALPSTDESFGIVYTEAMSYSKPVVAIDIPPVNEIVKNGSTGILVRQNDTEALSEALHKMLSDHAMRQSMGEKALEEFKRCYAPAVVIQRIVDVYKYSLSKRPDWEQKP
ncbi:MAG: glycosyltransferase family 4 protein [Chitinispirillaceae bacterium]|nr:glycosyltransferase family 4 protein [Chitinispirillaceae bacterium]